MKKTQLRYGMLFAIAVALLIAPLSDIQAKGKGFKDVVKHIETTYRAKKTRIPMLGLANFAVKLIRPAGVKGFKLAVFDDQDFLARPELGMSLGNAMRQAYNKDWMPLMQMNSRREGSGRICIFAKYSGKDVEFAVASLGEREALVLQVKFNPDAAARFLENPKIMGISLGNSVRGKGPAPGTIASGASGTARPRAAARSGVTRSSSGARTIAEMEAAASAEPKPRPALKPAASAEDENNPPLPGEAVAANAGKKAEAPELPAAKRPDASVNDTFRIETRLVNLNVKAIDRAGTPLTSLSLGDFEVYEDGVKQNVEHFRPVNAPVNVVLLIDLSGSTKKRRRSMADAAKRFIDTLPAQDKISVVAFTRRYKALTGFTSDKIALKNAVEQINNIEGGTAFYDSMWKALDDLDKVPDARKAIVVLTDGEDESLVSDEETAHTFDDLLGRASEEDVTIYPIYFKASEQVRKVVQVLGGGGSGSLLGNDNVRTARKQLESLAEQTGGEIVNAQREEDLQDAYGRVATELHTIYSLGYLPDSMKHDGGFRKITVKVTREGALARTRKGYFDR
ncbi:MAG: VWA domain-containing protein [Blastocatellia bacterium]|nr:VWA domain-containing protein [Blastocatellia bacterium]